MFSGYIIAAILFTLYSTSEKKISAHYLSCYTDLLFISFKLSCNTTLLLLIALHSAICSLHLYD